ncbi:MAG: hypothetical protein IKY52_13780 [Clostridia bacterium]|nr:hypothetical protein [Clostridia bacterium]
MKKLISSPWFRVILCAVVMILFIVIPSIVARTTTSNGLGAGVFVLTLFAGVPLSSLFCGILAAPDARKFWILPALPSVLLWLLWSMNGYLPFRLAWFAGLAVGYAAFAVAIDILRKIRNRKQ